MNFLNENRSHIKKACIIHFNLLLFVAKAALTCSICLGLKNLIPFQGAWLWLIWIVLSLVIDTFLIFKKPSFFTNTMLTEAEQAQYCMNSYEFTRYLSFSPKMRIARTLFVTFFVFSFLSISNWPENLPLGLLLGSVFVDFLIRTLFNVNTPKIFTPCAPDLSPTTLELHQNDISFAGSSAWTAVQSLKQFDNYRLPKI